MFKPNETGNLAILSFTRTLQHISKYRNSTFEFSRKMTQIKLIILRKKIKSPKYRHYKYLKDKDLYKF